MIELNDRQQMIITGGYVISGTLLNGIYRTINAILDLGRTFGTSLRMYREGKKCSL